jgi:hypothetical protein
VKLKNAYRERNEGEDGKRKRERYCKKKYEREDRKYYQLGYI